MFPTELPTYLSTYLPTYKAYSYLLKAIKIVLNGILDEKMGDNIDLRIGYFNEFFLIK